MNKNYLFLIFTFFLLSMTISLWSDNHSELLILRGEGQYPPFEMIVDGELIGIHMDIIKLAAEKLDVDVHFRSVPWSRAVELLKFGKGDAITFMGKRPEREEFAIFIEGNELVPTQSGFFYLKGEGDYSNYHGDLSFLSGKTIGMIRHFSYNEPFDNAQFLKKDENAESEEQLIDKLLNKRVDLIIGNVNRIKYKLQERGIAGKIVMLRPGFTPRPNFLAFSKATGKEKLAEDFAQAMKEIKNSMLFIDILENYGLDREDFYSDEY